MADNVKAVDGMNSDALSSKYSFPSALAHITKITVTKNTSSFMDSPCHSKGTQSLFHKCGFHISNFARGHTNQRLSNKTSISNLNDVFDAESISIRDHRPPPLSQTDTFEADTDSEDEDKEVAVPSTFCIGGILKNKFQTLGYSFGTFLGIHVPVRVIDEVPNESSLDSYGASLAPLTPQKASSASTVSSPCSNSVRSEITLPSLPGLFFKRNHRASHSETTNNCEDPQLDRNTRVLLSPRNHASLLGGFSQVKRETFSSTRVNENDRHSIEVLFSKASKAEFDQNYILSLDLFRKCLKMLYLLKSDPKEEEHEHDLQIASVHHSIGTLYWKMGDYEDSLDSLKEAYSRIKVLMNRYGTTETISLKEQLCDILNTTGKVYSSKGDYKSALNFHEESLSILKAALFGKDYTCSSTGSMQDSTNEIFHPGIVKSLICIGTVHAHCGRLTEAMATLKNGLDIQLKLIGPHHVDIAATLNAIGSVYEKSGRHEKAMQCYKKARQIYLREIGESHVDVAVTMNNIAQIYHHVGKYQKAMETYREALRVMINILGDSHRNVAAIMFNMGLVHVQCCQYSKAFEIFEETLQMQRASLGDFHVDVALTLESMGAIYEQSLKINKALEMYSKALVIRQKTSGDRLFVALTMDKIGKCQMNLNGDIKEALACFEKSIQIYRTCGISDDEPLVWEARQNYDSAVSILRKQKGLPM